MVNKTQKPKSDSPQRQATGKRTTNSHNEVQSSSPATSKSDFWTEERSDIVERYTNSIYKGELLEELKRCKAQNLKDLKAQAKKDFDQYNEHIEMLHKRWNVPKDEFGYIDTCELCKKPCMEIDDGVCFSCRFAQEKKEEELKVKHEKELSELQNKVVAWYMAWKKYK